MTADRSEAAYPRMLVDAFLLARTIDCIGLQNGAMDRQDAPPDTGLFSSGLETRAAPLVDATATDIPIVTADLRHARGDVAACSAARIADGAARTRPGRP